MVSARLMTMSQQKGRLAPPFPFTARREYGQRQRR